MQPQSLDYLTAQSRCVGVKKKKEKLTLLWVHSCTAYFIHAEKQLKKTMLTSLVGKVHFNGQH